MTTSLADNVLTDEDTNAVKFHAKKYAKYYEPGILDMEHHIRLVEKLKDLSRKTNVPEYFVYKTRVSDYCSEAEIDYVRKLKTWSDNGVAGLAFTGSVGGVEDKMMSIAGAITRNMI
ncbi:MAG: hypothetical protein GQ570_04075, partial [Helicobacteraceae bacterium]|nr:hypothetical protein [Helicobacteraceae bacterium]